jgi:DNA-binding transcriptional regulator YiaG
MHSSLETAYLHGLVEEEPSLSGPEVRFIRKRLDLTQIQLAELLGVEDQSVRRWEKLARDPVGPTFGTVTRSPSLMC